MMYTWMPQRIMCHSVHTHTYIILLIHYYLFLHRCVYCTHTYIVTLYDHDNNNKCLHTHTHNTLHTSVVEITLEKKNIKKVQLRVVSVDRWCAVHVYKYCCRVSQNMTDRPCVCAALVARAHTHTHTHTPAGCFFLNLFYRSLCLLV